MNTDDILKYVKFNLSLSTSVRDEYLKFIIESTISRLKRAGIDPDGQNTDYQNEYFSYVVDEVCNMYRNRGGEIALPEGLTYRRNSLIVHKEDV